MGADAAEHGLVRRDRVKQGSTEPSIGLLTAADVHAGRVAEITAARAVTLDAAYAAHPERFVRHSARPPEVPSAVWINPPTAKEMPPQ